MWAHGLFPQTRMPIVYTFLSSVYKTCMPIVHTCLFSNLHVHSPHLPVHKPAFPKSTLACFQTRMPIVYTCLSTNLHFHSPHLLVFKPGMLIGYTCLSTNPHSQSPHLLVCFQTRVPMVYTCLAYVPAWDFPVESMMSDSFWAWYGLSWLVAPVIYQWADHFQPVAHAACQLDLFSFAVTHVYDDVCKVGYILCKPIYLLGHTLFCGVEHYILWWK